MLKKAFANSLEELAEIVKSGMYWQKVVFHPDGSVENGKGIMAWCKWQKKGKRYAFYTD